MINTYLKTKSKQAYCPADNKVLFISYLFPPAGGVGVLRVLKFVKYLPQFGYEPYVLTVKKPFYHIDGKSLLKEIPDSVKITQINYFEPGLWWQNRWWQGFWAYFLYPWILIPDNRAFWILPAIIKAYKIIKREKIKLIFTSSSSVSDHIVAYYLKKLTGVKWVADFRDEWTKNKYFRFPTPLHRLIAENLEKKVLEAADQITTVSPLMVENFQGLTAQKDKISLICNGFDPDDFPAVAKSHRSYCEIIYAGTLMRNQRTEALFQAVKELNLPKLKINFFGGKVRLPHHEMTKRLCQADILLFIQSSSEQATFLTAKIYEYLAARRPILALAPRHTAAVKLIQKLGVGEVANPDNVAEIKEKILKMYQKWLASRRSGEKNELKVPRPNIDEFSRKNLTEKLVKIFENLTKKPKIKVCLIGNLQSSHNINAVNYLKQESTLEIHFITPKKNHIPGIKTYYVPHLETKNIFRAAVSHFKTVKTIKKLVNHIKPDIIHGQPLNFPGIWAMLTNKHPLIVMIWGSDINNYEKYLWPEQYLIKRTLQKADLILTNCLIGSGQKAIQVGANQAKIKMLQFGIDLDIFKKQPVDALRKKFKLIGKKIIFCPRSIKSVYNIDITIQAFEMIARHRKDLILALMEPEESQYSRQIKTQIAASGVKNQIIFLPKVINSKIVDYYNLADIAIMVTTSEGCSSSFMEALACEKKIVLTRLPVLKEWPGKYWTVPVRDAAQTAQKLLEALDFPDQEFLPLGQKNRELVVRQGESTSNFQKLVNFYHELS